MPRTRGTLLLTRRQALGELAQGCALRYASSMGRRLVASFAVLGLLLAPAVASTRFFCKSTGVEIVGCDEQRTPERTTIRGDGCCERRTLAPAGTAIAATQSFLAEPVATSAEVTFIVDPANGLASGVLPTADAGPPLFLSHRALLI